MILCNKLMNPVIQSFKRFYTRDTIFSLSSGFGKCGVSIIRVSGPQTCEAIKNLVAEDFKPKARYAHLKPFFYPKTKDIIDKGLILWFPTPGSFTGEDACEFQVHGSQAVVAAMLNALAQLPGFRAAEKGEFAKRAFMAGKLDLTEVDGLADLIHAETEAQRKQAVLQSNGLLSQLYNNWRQRIISCAAHLEAYIDFADEEQIEQDVLVQVDAQLSGLLNEINTHLNDQRQGELTRDGVFTVIIGAPNVGKSSLLNLLCQRDVSIVTPLAGTTRDVIETSQNFGGYPVIFADTAGLRKETEDIVERAGIDKAKTLLHRADLILLLVDGRNLLKNKVKTEKDLQEYIENYLQSLNITTELAVNNPSIQLVANKIDLLTEHQLEELKSLKDLFYISCLNNQHVEQFSNQLASCLKNLCGTPSIENPRITNRRYRQELNVCSKQISLFLHEFSPSHFPDMAISVQKLRKAIRCVERVTGHISTDDILDVVFRDFCIGK